MSYFKPAEGMIIQGFKTNRIFDKSKYHEERLKVLTFEQNPGLKRRELKNYDKAYYHIATVNIGGSDKEMVEINEVVNGIDVKGKRVRGNPVHLVESKGYLIIHVSI